MSRSLPLSIPLKRQQLANLLRRHADKDELRNLYAELEELADESETELCAAITYGLRVRVKEEHHITWSRDQLTIH
jgi:hypothetical protein